MGCKPDNAVPDWQAPASIEKQIRPANKGNAVEDTKTQSIPVHPPSRFRHWASVLLSAPTQRAVDAAVANVMYAAGSVLLP